MNHRTHIERALLLLGAGLVTAGVFANEWMLAALFSPDGILAPSTLREIRLFDLGCVAAGVVLMTFHRRVLELAVFCCRRSFARRETLFKVVGVLFPFLFLECLLRLSGCDATYTERNGGAYTSAYNQENVTPWILDSGVKQVYRFTRPEFNYVVRTNSEGIRDIEHAVHKPEGEYRIIGLGDSFTMGVGAAYEDTYLKDLERTLNEACPHREFEAICGGVSGSDPVYSYYLFTKRLLKYKPDLVILLINETDVFDLMTRGGMDRFGPDGILKKVDAPRLEWIFARSRLVRAVLLTFFRYDYYLMRPAERRQRMRATIPVLAQVAGSFQELAGRYGFTFLVAAQPYAWSSFEKEVPGFSGMIERALTDSQVMYADLTAFFEKRLGKQEFIEKCKWPIDGHYNARGYAVLAEGIQDVLGARLRSDESPCH